MMALMPSCMMLTAWCKQARRTKSLGMGTCCACNHSAASMSSCKYATAHMPGSSGARYTGLEQAQIANESCQIWPAQVEQTMFLSPIQDMFMSSTGCAKAEASPWHLGPRWLHQSEK